MNKQSVKAGTWVILFWLLVIALLSSCGAKKSSQTGDCNQCPPLTPHYPIESAYREDTRLVLNFYGGEIEYVQVQDKKKAYRADYLNYEKSTIDDVSFEYIRELIKGVCVEYIVLDGERIYVRSFNDWDKAEIKVHSDSIVESFKDSTSGK